MQQELQLNNYYQKTELFICLLGRNSAYVPAEKVFLAHHLIG